jgi:hypothetical protein
MIDMTGLRVDSTSRSSVIVVNQNDTAKFVLGLGLGSFISKSISQAYGSNIGEENNKDDERHLHSAYSYNLIRFNSIRQEIIFTSHTYTGYFVSPLPISSLTGRICIY